MSHHVHPTWPTRHRPTITTNDLGAHIACECGWWATAPNEPRASVAYLAHTIEAKSEEETNDE